MYFIYLLTKNRLKIDLNKFLYLNNDNKNKKGSLVFLIGVLVLTALLVSVISFALSFILLDVVNYFFKTQAIKIDQQFKWLSFLLLIIFLLFVSDNIFTQYINLYKSNDIKLALTSPVPLNQFIISKFIEPYLNNALIGLIIAVPFLCSVIIKYNLNWISGITLIALFLYFIYMIILIRSLIIMLMIIQKAKNKNLLLFIIYNLFSFYVTFSIILVALKPFQIYFSAFVNKTIEKISVLFPVTVMEHFEILYIPFIWMFKLLYEFSGLGITGHSLLILSFYLVISLVFSYLIVKLAKYLERYQLVEAFYENANSKKRKTQKRDLLSRFEFFDIGTKNMLLGKNLQLIILKDIKILFRENKLYWTSSVITIFAGYFVTVLGYYLAIHQIEISGFQNYIGIVITLFTSQNIANAMLDKYGFDAEGVRFHLLKLMPIKSRELIMSKFIQLVVINVPFWMIFSFITSLIFHVNFVFMLFILIMSTFALGMICLYSNIVYPDFYYEDSLKIPTLKARLLASGISTAFLLVTSAILFKVQNTTLQLLSVFFISIALGSFLFLLIKEKIEKYTL